MKNLGRTQQAHLAYPEVGQNLGADAIGPLIIAALFIAMRSEEHTFELQSR